MRIILWIGCLLTVVGCSSQPEPTIVVQGRVFYQGRPLSGGLIVFLPDEERGTTGELASASIQRDGSYTLASEDPTGISPGWHRIMIAGPTSTNYPVIPNQYRHPQHSGLFGEVKKQTNHIDIYLEGS